MAKKITIEKLAEMVHKGFLETARKDELTSLRKDTNEGFRLVAEASDLIRADVRDIKITLGPLVRTVAA